MGKIEGLIKNYENYVSLPLDRKLAGSQRIWFALYDPNDEKRIRARITEFELATKKAKRGWRQINLTDIFSKWMSKQKYMKSYFEDPGSLEIAFPELRDWIAEEIRLELEQSDESEIVALIGVASLFGFCRISSLLPMIESEIKGILLVFFPGQFENNNYRLLDARDGWNYLAVPISANEGN
jgi:hypothetical protein